MIRLAALALAGCCYSVVALAQNGAQQLVGTWKLTSWLVKFEGGDTIEPWGPSPKGRLVLTSGGYWIVILAAANRGPAKSSDEKAALLETMLAYSGKYTVDGDRITVLVDISSNERFSGANQTLTRLFSVEGDKLTLRVSAGQIASAAKPGQKAEGTLTWERER